MARGKGATVSIELSPIWTPWHRTRRQGSRAECHRMTDAMYRLCGGGPMIDLGCGEAPLTKDFSGVWIDSDPRIPAGVELNGTFLHADIRQAPYMQLVRNLGPYNLMAMTDVIEHLRPEDAFRLVKVMSEQCRNAFVFTPLGHLSVVPEATDPHSHKSGWWPETFWASGWQVWEWPEFHLFPNGYKHGAFFAWHMENPVTPLQLAVHAEIEP